MVKATKDEVPEPSSYAKAILAGLQRWKWIPRNRHRISEGSRPSAQNIYAGRDSLSEHQFNDLMRRRAKNKRARKQRRVNRLANHRKGVR